MYSLTFFVLAFVCLMFGAANSHVIPDRNGASNVNFDTPQGIVLVKRSNELLAQANDGMLGTLGGRAGKSISPILQGLDTGIDGRPKPLRS